jgi:hypothetical protein
MQLQINTPLKEIQIGGVINITRGFMEQVCLGRCVLATPSWIVVKKVIAFIPGLLEFMV